MVFEKKKRRRERKERKRKEKRKKRKERKGKERRKEEKKKRKEKKRKGKRNLEIIVPNRKRESEKEKGKEEKGKGKGGKERKAQLPDFGFKNEQERAPYWMRNNQTPNKWPLSQKKGSGGGWGGEEVGE